MKSRDPLGKLTVASALLLGVFAVQASASVDVLLLGDENAERQVQRILEAAGHNVTTVINYQWDGINPNINGFDVVVYLDGFNYGAGLQLSADTAIANFVAGGGGLVMTEWVAWDIYFDHLTPGITALMPVYMPAYGYSYGGPWNVVDTAHPLAAFLRSEWCDPGEFAIVVPHANATVIIEGIDGNPQLTYRTDSGGPVVHLNHSMSYVTPIINPNILRALVNSVEFAAKVTPADCNGNEIADFLDFAADTTTDTNGNRVLDECDPDCNGNGTPDDLDVARGRPFSMVPFEFDVETPANWDFVTGCSGCDTGAVPLDFSVTLGGQTLTHFLMDSHGYVELFRAGETPNDYGYGYVWDLIRYGTEQHTYLMAAYGELDSRNVGGFGYRKEPGGITFYWETPTYEDEDGTYDHMIIFQMHLHTDGTVRWNFGSQAVSYYYYDLYSGIYFGYGRGELHQLYQGFVPELESWVYTPVTEPYSQDLNGNTIPDECEEDCNGNGVPDDVDVLPAQAAGLVQEVFTFQPGAPLEWSDYGDGGDTGVVALPFSVSLSGETFTSFVQNSDGKVELLRAGDQPYNFSYGYVADLIASNGGVPGNPTHTYLLAGFDDLTSDYRGWWGYRDELDRVVFYWYTETYSDAETRRINEFEIVLGSDSVVHWNFNVAYHAEPGWDLFSGLYLGYAQQTLLEIAQGYLPERQSWAYSESGFLSGGSDDANGDGVPDECAGKGDLNGDGLVDIADVVGLTGCLDGPETALGGGCLAADFDNDGDVDLEDMAAFWATF